MNKPITRVSFFRRMPAGGTAYTAPSTPDRETEIRHAMTDKIAPYVINPAEDDIFVGLALDLCSEVAAAREAALLTAKDAEIADLRAELARWQEQNVRIANERDQHQARLGSALAIWHRGSSDDADAWEDLRAALEPA